MATSALNQLTGMPSLPMTRKVMGDMPAAPKGYLGAKEIMPAQEELVGEIGAAEERVGQADIAIERAKREEKARELEAKGESLTKYVKDVEAMPERAALKESREALKGMEFVPTRDTVNDIAGLFSLIGVIGMVVGKGNAMQAMSAMNGMLAGHQKGRQDLFKQEQATFDKNFKAMQMKVQQALADYQEALELKKTDREAGEIAKQVALARMESPFMTAMEKKVGEVRVLNNLKDTKKAMDEAVKLQNDLQAKADQRRKEELQREEMRAGKAQVFQGSDKKMYSYDPYSRKITEIDTGGVTLTKPGGRGTTAGQNALTFASRVYSNIENAAQDLKNIVAMPATASLPIFSGLLNTERDSALKSMESLIARKITKDENRAFQQVSDQLGSALARLEAQGLATGSTKANIAAFNSLRPAAGDSAINMALYIARVKQEIETGIRVHNKMPGATEEQKETTKQILDSLDTFVPFDTDDVLRVLRKNKAPLGDKMSRLIQQPAIAPDLNTSGSAAPSAAAPTTPGSTGQTTDINELRKRANDAISKGADPEKVKARFKEVSGGQEL